MQPQVSFKQAFCSFCSIVIFVANFVLFFLICASIFVFILVAVHTSVVVLCLFFFAFVVVVDINCASAHSAVFASF